MMNLSCDLVRLLDGYTFASAESCTGGLIGAAVTDIPGSSKVYKGGIICYTNAVKEEVLGINKNTLSSFGAVSAEVAEAMAMGVKKLLHSDFAVSTTGLAGPSGDEFGNPVGTVYIGVSTPKSVYVRRFVFSGDRDAVRNQATQRALQLVIQAVEEFRNENNT